MQTSTPPKHLSDAIRLLRQHKPPPSRASLHTTPRRPAHIRIIPRETPRDSDILAKPAIRNVIKAGVSVEHPRVRDPAPRRYLAPGYRRQLPVGDTPPSTAADEEEEEDKYEDLSPAVVAGLRAKEPARELVWGRDGFERGRYVDARFAREAAKGREKWVWRAVKGRRQEPVKEVQTPQQEKLLEARRVLFSQEAIQKTTAAVEERVREAEEVERVALETLAKVWGRDRGMQGWWGEGRAALKERRDVHEVQGLDGFVTVGSRVVDVEMDTDRRMDREGPVKELGRLAFSASPERKSAEKQDMERTWEERDDDTSNVAGSEGNKDHCRSVKQNKDDGSTSISTKRQERKKTVAEIDRELQERMAGHAGDGGEAGIELEDGQPVAMKRSVKNNMFRYI